MIMYQLQWTDTGILDGYPSRSVLETLPCLAQFGGDRVGPDALRSVALLQTSNWIIALTWGVGLIFFLVKLGYLLSITFIKICLLFLTF